ncbi:ABC transporter substrate-binding protein [Caulobacter segnis]
MASLATALVGSGPFKFAGWRRGDTVTLARNDGYSGPAREVEDGAVQVHRRSGGGLRGDQDPRGRARLPRLSGPEKPGPAARRSGPEGGLRRRQRGRGDPAAGIWSAPGPLADVRVRRALQHALDRQAIVDGAMYGHGTPDRQPLPRRTPAYVDLTGLYPTTWPRPRRCWRKRVIQTAWT